MSLSIQTNVASLSAENNIRLNSQFQNQTINRLSSGYRINSSADDAAGLAVANQLQGTVTELTQGVQNANNSVSQLQVIDGGLNNITQILNRLQTLATESASNTFTGDRNTLNAEYQSDLAEINRQAANIGLNTGGQYNAQLSVFTGGGTSQSNSVWGSKRGFKRTNSPYRATRNSITCASLSPAAMRSRTSSRRSRANGASESSID